MKKFIFLIFAFTPLFLQAESKRDVPLKLFDIKLGGIYDIGKCEKNDIGDIPVKKCISAYKFLGSGIHYFFQPLKEYKAFKYFERPGGIDNKYDETPFHLYLLPVIPEKIHTLDQLKTVTKLNWEVVSVDWELDRESVDDAYFWVLNMCELFSVDIAVKPDIINQYENKFASCKFKGKDRVLSISHLSKIQTIRLAYTTEVGDEKNKAVEEKLNKLKVEEIRPY